MATAHASIVVRHIRSLMMAERTGQLSDRVLLQRFTQGREEAAFATLVRRHGPLVLGVCRRVLHNPHDAEDAFQATFLVLARKAGSVGRQGSLAGWLYQVAYHLALKARARAANRHQRESQSRVGHGCDSRALRAADPLEELTGRELLCVLDEELQELPDRYRTPLVLCYLEGRTRDQAAHHLGWSVRTLHRRLEEGKEQLRSRLARRGLALSAGLLAAGLSESAATAAVPSMMVQATVQAAVVAAAGHAVSGSAAQLAEGALHAMSATKIKLVSTVLFALALVGGGVAALARQALAEGKDEATPPEAPAKRESKPKPAAKKAAVLPDQPKPSDKEQMTVSGRVLDPGGKALASAAVAVLARQGLQLSSWENWAAHRNEVLGRTKTDAEGRFRLVVPRTAAEMNVRQVRVVAGAPGFGFNWKAVDPNAEQAETEIRLGVEQPIRGRFLDLQGQPAPMVSVHVVRISRQAAKGEKDDDAALRVPRAGLPIGPRTATTDAKGEFVLRGFAPQMKVELQVRDPRYERTDEWIVDTGDKQKCENIRKVLAPGYFVEGRVIYADTRKPVPHARLEFANPIVDDQADAQGRFQVSLFPPYPLRPGSQERSEHVTAFAYPPEGEPYLTGTANLHFPKGVVRREVEIALPRAVLVHGKITEAGSGKPVAGAYLEGQGYWNVRVRSGPNGSYQMGVPEGTKRLLVIHPSGDYIPQAIGSAEMLAGKPGGDRVYFHGVVPLELKPGDKTKEVPITLRRGVTVKGKLLGPDGKPITAAVMFVSGHRPANEKTIHPTQVQNGQFEVHGLDPEKSCRLIFLEHAEKIRLVMGAEAINTFGQLLLTQLVGPHNKLGVAVEISAKKAAAEPLIVRLAPCGSAKVRFLDGAGKPVANRQPWLQLLVTPGPPANQAISEGKLSADVVTLITQYQDFGGKEPHTDKDGYVTIQGLIPGATYRLKKPPFAGEVLKDFTVEVGKTSELEVTVK